MEYTQSSVHTVECIHGREHTELNIRSSTHMVESTHNPVHTQWSVHTVEFTYGNNMYGGDLHVEEQIYGETYTWRNIDEHTHGGTYTRR